MSGTVAGGNKAARTNKKNDPNFYRIIGAMGGRKGKKDGVIKGFGANPGLAKKAGAKGGTISRRGKPMAKPVEQPHQNFIKRILKRK